MQFQMHCLVFSKQNFLNKIKTLIVKDSLLKNHRKFMLICQSPLFSYTGIIFFSQRLFEN